jgi:hypothetical protein
LATSTKAWRDEYWLTIGFMDKPERFKPAVHAFWSMKLPWIEFADHLPWLLAAPAAE